MSVLISLPLIFEGANCLECLFSNPSRIVCASALLVDDPEHVGRPQGTMPSFAPLCGNHAEVAQVDDIIPAGTPEWLRR